jgi:hypothetical protein
MNAAESRTQRGKQLPDFDTLDVNGKTKTGRLWAYVRDGRPAGSEAAVWFAYSPDRKGEHPVRHLQNYVGFLQADGCAGFNKLHETGRIVEAACWERVRVRRPVLGASIAYRERGVWSASDNSTELSRRSRADRQGRGRKFGVATITGSDAGMTEATLGKLSQKSNVAVAIRYALLGSAN